MIKRIVLFLLLLSFNKSNLFSQLYFNEVSSFEDFNHTYFNGVSGAGVSFVDFNQDGLDDISIPTNSENSILFDDIFKSENVFYSRHNFCYNDTEMNAPKNTTFERCDN